MGEFLTISFSARAHLLFKTATLIISHPALASSSICLRVAKVSSVLVFVID